MTDAIEDSDAIECSLVTDSDVAELRAAFAAQIPYLHRKALRPELQSLTFRKGIVEAIVVELCMPTVESIDGETFVKTRRTLTLRWRLSDETGATPEPEHDADRGAHNAYGDAVHAWADALLRRRGSFESLL